MTPKVPLALEAMMEVEPSNLDGQTGLDEDAEMHYQAFEGVKMVELRENKNQKRENLLLEGGDEEEEDGEAGGHSELTWMISVAVSASVPAVNTQRPLRLTDTCTGSGVATWLRAGVGFTPGAAMVSGSGDKKEWLACADASVDQRNMVTPKVALKF